MAIARITKAAVDAAMGAARLTGAAAIVYDSDLKGFGLRANKNGTATYFIEYRTGCRGRDKQRYKIGSHAAFTPQEARRRAQELLGSVARGIDPQAEKQAERERAAAMSFAELWADYFAFRDDGTPYWAKLRGIFKREVPSVIANRPAEVLTRAELRRVLDKTREKSLNTERWLAEPLFWLGY